MNIIRYSRLAAGACCACVLGAGLLPQAAWADWEAIPDIRMEIEANDNPRLGQRPDRRDVDPEAFEDHTATRMLLDSRVRLRNIGPRGRVLRPTHHSVSGARYGRGRPHLPRRGDAGWRARIDVHDGRCR